MEDALQYLGKIHDHAHNVLSEIYMITNHKDGKCYIGQTVTHRLNHKRYRPFGYEARFRSHVSEALCDSKKQQCSCLANAIRRDGPESFGVELLVRCFKEDADRLEVGYIANMDTLHPNGYNLALGGRNRYNATNEAVVPIPSAYVPTPRTAPRTEETRKKIGQGITAYMRENDAAQVFAQYKHARDVKKMEMLRGAPLYEPLEQYIQARSYKGKKFARVAVGDVHISFQSQFEEWEESKQRALTFLQNVVKMNAEVPRHLQIAGTP
jgi:hypothetical protein